MDSNWMRLKWGGLGAEEYRGIQNEYTYDSLLSFFGGTAQTILDKFGFSNTTDAKNKLKNSKLLSLGINNSQGVVGLIPYVNATSITVDAYMSPTHAGLRQPVDRTFEKNKGRQKGVAFNAIDDYAHINFPMETHPHTKDLTDIQIREHLNARKFKHLPGIPLPGDIYRDDGGDFDNEDHGKRDMYGWGGHPTEFFVNPFSNANLTFYTHMQPPYVTNKGIKVVSGNTFTGHYIPIGYEGEPTGGVNQVWGPDAGPFASSHTGTITALTPGGIVAGTAHHEPTISPDGTKFAYLSYESPSVGTGRDVFLRDISGAGPRNISEEIETFLIANPGTPYTRAWGRDSRSVWVDDPGFFDNLPGLFNELQSGLLWGGQTTDQGILTANSGPGMLISTSRYAEDGVPFAQFPENLFTDIKYVQFDENYIIQSVDRLFADWSGGPGSIGIGCFELAAHAVPGYKSAIIGALRPWSFGLSRALKLQSARALGDDLLIHDHDKSWIPRVLFTRLIFHGINVIPPIEQFLEITGLHGSQGSDDHSAWYTPRQVWEGEPILNPSTTTRTRLTSDGAKFIPGNTDSTAFDEPNRHSGLAINAYIGSIINESPGNLIAYDIYATSDELPAAPGPGNIRADFFYFARNPRSIGITPAKNGWDIIASKAGPPWNRKSPSWRAGTHKICYRPFFNGNELRVVNWNYVTNDWTGSMGLAGAGSKEAMAVDDVYDTFYCSYTVYSTGSAPPPEAALHPGSSSSLPNAGKTAATTTSSLWNSYLGSVTSFAKGEGGSPSITNNVVFPDDFVGTVGDPATDPFASHRDSKGKIYSNFHFNLDLEEGKNYGSDKFSTTTNRPLPVFVLDFSEDKWNYKNSKTVSIIINNSARIVGGGGAGGMGIRDVVVTSKAGDVSGGGFGGGGGGAGGGTGRNLQEVTPSSYLGYLGTGFGGGGWPHEDPALSQSSHNIEAQDGTLGSRWNVGGYGGAKAQQESSININNSTYIAHNLLYGSGTDGGDIFEVKHPAGVQPIIEINNSDVGIIVSGGGGGAGGHEVSGGSGGNWARHGQGTSGSTAHEGGNPGYIVTSENSTYTRPVHIVNINNGIVHGRNPQIPSHDTSNTSGGIAGGWYVTGNVSSYYGTTSPAPAYAPDIDAPDLPDGL
jgi:glycosyltransferase involved in cell wall biosynthesis